VECTTGQRPTFVKPTLQIRFADGDAATMGMTYLYIDRWSAITTWGGEAPPTEGESAVIPAGQNVLLDVSPPPLVLIIIEGRLLFEDAQDINLQAKYIMLRNGTMQVRAQLPLPCPSYAGSYTVRSCVHNCF